MVTDQCENRLPVRRGRVQVYDRFIYASCVHPYERIMDNGCGLESFHAFKCDTRKYLDIITSKGVENMHPQAVSTQSFGISPATASIRRSIGRDDKQAV